MSGTLWSGREKNSTSLQTARKDDEGRKHTRKIVSDRVLHNNIQRDKLWLKNKTVTFYADKNCFTNLITWKRTHRKLKNANYFEASNQFASLVLKTFSSAGTQGILQSAIWSCLTLLLEWFPNFFNSRKLAPLIVVLCRWLKMLQNLSYSDYTITKHSMWNSLLRNGQSVIRQQQCVVTYTYYIYLLQHRIC